MTGQKLNHEQFVIRAIANRRGNGYKGIHTVYSDFNAAFRLYFPNDNPVDITKSLAEKGKIVIIPCKGGAMLYMPADAPQRTDNGKRAEQALASILA